MEIIIPVEIKPEHIQYTNVDFSTYPEYDNTTTYTSDSVVYEGTKVYQSLQDGNTGNSPTDVNSNWWIEIHNVNQLLPFDNTLEMQAQQENLIEYYFVLQSNIDAIALFSVSGSHIEVEVERDSQTIYSGISNLIDVQDNPYGNWGLYFSKMTHRSFGMFFNLPALSGDLIKLRILADDETAKVGEIFIGENYVIGETLENTESELVNYSRITFNDWGRLNIVKRGHAKRIKFQFSFEHTEYPKIDRLLTRIKDRICIFHGGEILNSRLSLIIPGIYESYSLPLVPHICFGTLDAVSVVSLSEIN